MYKDVPRQVFMLVGGLNIGICQQRLQTIVWICCDVTLSDGQLYYLYAF